MARASNTTNVQLLKYDLIRNLTSSSEKTNSVQTWFANVSARDIMGFGTTDNLRSYIAEHNPAKRNAVHEQIARTIDTEPDRFINRNSGITITCTECEVDDAKKVARLVDASIINGAQTQGEIRRYFEDLEEGDESDFLLRAEVIADPVHSSIVEIAIARNTATAVKSVSQAGARGYLVDLKKSVEKGLPGETLQMTETDTTGINTQMVLQHTRLLMPQALMGDKAPQRNLAYKQGGKCLSDFSDWARARASNEDFEKYYNFVIDMAPVAIKQYRKWEKHAGWSGQRLHEFGKSKPGDKPVGGRPVKRDKKTNKVVWVAPGILFPIIGALSAFVVQKAGHWVLDIPALFSEEDMIRRAVQQFRALGRDVAGMGRNEAVYDALSIYTETIASVLASNSSAQTS